MGWLAPGIAEEGRKELGSFVLLLVVVSRTIGPKQGPPCEGRAKRSLRLDPGSAKSHHITSHHSTSRTEKDLFTSRSIGSGAFWWEAGVAIGATVRGLVVDDFGSDGRWDGMGWDGPVSYIPRLGCKLVSYAALRPHCFASHCIASPRNDWYISIPD
jgi:hypothetical protein